MTSPESFPFVRVVLLDFNGGSTIVDAVSSAVSTQWPKDRFEVVCVDNGSTDGSIEEIEHHFPSVKIIRNGANLGFPGNNVALGDLEEVDYVALVNSDALVAPTWLAPLVDRAEADKGIGAVCPKILLADQFLEIPIGINGVSTGASTAVILRSVAMEHQDLFSRCHVAEGGGRSSDRDGIFERLADGAILRVPVGGSDGLEQLADVSVELEALESCVVVLAGDRVQERALTRGERIQISLAVERNLVDVLNNAGSWLDDSWVGHERGLYEVDRGQFDQSVDVGTWCGAAVLLRAKQIEDVGVFEDSFFLYYEDTDLAARGRGRGWRFVLEPKSVVRHIHSASTVEGSDVAAFHIERNRLLLVLRHAPAKVIVRAFLRYLLVRASYARAAIAQSRTRRHLPDFKIVSLRLRSFFGAVRLLPASIAARRHIASRRYLSRAELKQLLALGSSDAAPGSPKGAGLRSPA